MATGWKQILSLCCHKKSYGWYKNLSFCSWCLFALWWEIMDSLQLPVLSCCPRQVLPGLQGLYLAYPRNPSVRGFSQSMYLAAKHQVGAQSASTGWRTPLGVLPSVFANMCSGNAPFKGIPKAWISLSCPGLVPPWGFPLPSLQMHTPG